MFIALLLTPNGWGWWMDVHSVQGRELDGLVYYSVKGVNFTLNDPQTFPGSKPRQRIVFYLSSQPSSGSLHNTANEVIDWGLTAGPGAVGFVLLATGFAKRHRRKSSLSASDPADSFGHGIPSGTIRAIVSRDRHPGA